MSFDTVLTFVMAGLASVVFASAVKPRIIDSILASTGIGVTLIIACAGLQVDNVWLGAIIILCTLLFLAGYLPPWTCSLLAGVFSGSWLLLSSQTVITLAVMTPLAMLVPLLTQRLKGQCQGFWHPGMHDESVLVVLLSSIVSTAFPAIKEGWRSAANLNPGTPESSMLIWPIIAMVVAACVGGLFAYWRRQ